MGVADEMREASYSAFLLGGLQVALVFWLLGSVFAYVHLVRTGAARNSWPATARYGSDLLCCVGMVPWWTGRLAVVTACAASAMVLLCLLDGFLGPVPSGAAATHALLVLAAAVVAVARIHTAASLDGSFGTWFLTCAGVFLLMVCALSATTDSVGKRFGHAVSGLACVGLGLSMMTV
ncbi:hypothetical protein [Streptomyces sp. NPDC090025]|uniref:hypothetical protein n=1 Tax=Streptomyces sp. NPDC090025 TaxID=3365922 RepID=UPI003837FD38